jgi:hypothetical protein
MRFNDKHFSISIGCVTFFYAQWFFGNLYEQIVIAPNHLTDSYEAIQKWKGFFKISNPIFFYVPFTQLAVVICCLLYSKSPHPDEKKLLGKACVFAILAVMLTIVIVTQLNLKLFFGEIEKYKDQYFRLSVFWLIGNGIRLFLVGSALYFVTKVGLRRAASFNK